MAEKVATYSRIISPEDYNRIITFEHLYISASDRVIKEFVEKYTPKDRLGEVVEIGCGPGRILPLIAQASNIHLVGIDHDPEFVTYAKALLQKEGIKAEVHLGDFTSRKNPRLVDVFYSQGVHHHIAKGKDTLAYLKAIASQISENGVYILSDELLPEYSNEQEREVRAVIWYSHIIASAKRLNYTFLAQEEAKTLLDDLRESGDESEIKNLQQIKLVLEHCVSIDQTAVSHIEDAKGLAEDFLRKLRAISNTERTGDETVDLSRGDYKICDSAFRREMSDAGFEVLERKTVGPVDTLGGMAVYVLKRTALLN